MNNSNLSKLLELRTSIRDTEFEVKEIMPHAIIEALDSLSDPNSKNQIAFRNKLGKIVVVYRKRYPSLKDSQKLTNCDEWIRQAQTDLVNAKRTKLDEINRQIKEHEEAIKKLEEQRNNLLTNKRIITLKTKYLEIQESESWTEPNLSIFLS